MMSFTFADQPLLRVSRPVSACSRCRNAKVKCDGKLPACTACEKSGRISECSSANDQFARGKERSYVAALETRIEKLERRLSYARLRSASISKHDPDHLPPIAPPASATDRKDSLAAIRAAIHRQAVRKRENSDVNTLVSDFGFLSVNATTRDFEPSITNMTFARLVLAATTNDPLPLPIHIQLPPRQVAHSMLQYYISVASSLLPIVCESTLVNGLEILYRGGGQADLSASISDPDYCIFFLALAIASTAQSECRGDHHYLIGAQFVSLALARGDGALAPGKPSQIQCLALLTQYSMLDPTHFDSWHLIGLTCRSVIDLGFHQDLPPQNLSDQASIDNRRRIFWCVYALDRAISMVHARAFSFTDDAVNVAFPQATAPPASDPSPGPALTPPAALLSFQLRRAQSQWYQELFQSRADPLLDPVSYVWRVCRDMRDWGEHLPASLPAEVRNTFELELHYSYVYCIAPSARGPHLTDYGRSLIFEHTIAYLDASFDMAHRPINPSIFTFHDVLKVYFMASQLVAVLRDAEDTLLARTPPAPSFPLSPAFRPPPLPLRRSPASNLERSLRCLECVPQTLRTWGRRWIDALSLMASFDRPLSAMVGRLRERRDGLVFLAPPGLSSGPPPLLSPQPSLPLPQHHGR